MANPIANMVVNAKDNVNKIKEAYSSGFEKGINKGPIELPFVGMLTGATDGAVGTTSNLADFGTGGAMGTGGSDASATDSTFKDTSENIASGGSKVINIAVNVAKLVGIENVSTTTIKENTVDAAEAVRKEMNKILNGGLYVANA